MVYCNLLQDPRWVADHNNKVRHILGHHASCANRDTSADGYAGKNHAVAAKPAVFPDLDRLSRLGSVGTVTQEGVERMCAAVKRAVGTDQSTCSDLDGTGVNPRAARIDIDAFSYSTRTNKSRMFTNG